MKPPPSLAATAVACAALLSAALALCAGLTDGFEHWTFEERRRQQASQARLQAPAPLRIRTSSGQQARLFDGAVAGVYLVDFIYTRCPAVCQALGAEYFQMQEALRAAPPSRIKLVSLSFDVLHDQQPALAAYARLHRADAGLWTVAAPLQAGASEQLLQQLGVVAVPDGQGGFVHNSAIHLIDGRGRVRQIFDYADWQAALRAAQKMAAQ